jgi:hypothetical protein
MTAGSDATCFSVATATGLGLVSAGVMETLLSALCGWLGLTGPLWMPGPGGPCSTARRGLRLPLTLAYGFAAVAALTAEAA